MATEITKEKLLNNLNELKEILELPSLYLANFFEGLRNDVDIEFAPKQLELQNNREKKNQLNELWQQMITKIYSFEKNCIKDSYDLETNKKRINEIEKLVSHQDSKDLTDLEDLIETEEINLLKNLFQNSTIAFVLINEINENSLVKKKLVILNDQDDFISNKSIEIK